jgi:DNA adenine methylase
MGKAFSSSVRLRGGKPGDENAWNTWKQALPAIAERLNKVKVHNENGINILKEYANNQEMFIYADPPYYPETRVSKKVYNHEMSKEDHIEFLEAILSFKGKAIVMGYDSALYRKMLKRWKLRTIPIVNHSSQTKIKETKVECLWLNYKN